MRRTDLAQADTSVDWKSYQAPRECLVAILDAKKRANPSYSLRAWATELGFRSPSLMSDILKGRRKLKPELAGKILDLEGVEGDDRKYFELSVYLDNARSAEEKAFFAREMEALGGKVSNKVMSLEKFRFVADWYHWLLYEMVGMGVSFKDLKKAQEQILPPLSLASIQIGFDRLKRLGLIREKSSGQHEKASPDIWVGEEIPSDAIRKHHQGFLERAAESLQLPVEERHFSGTNIVLDEEGYAEAKRLIDALHRDLHKLDCSQKKTKTKAVFRLNLQLFPLTKRMKPR